MMDWKVIDLFKLPYLCLSSSRVILFNIAILLVISTNEITTHTIQWQPILNFKN